jgi:AbrB family looped-hinge helix DNA binding protein
MQTTGIVRKLDDLGRITIPQNIKRRLNVTGGDKLEVFLLSDGVAFKKYTPLAENGVARKCCLELGKLVGKVCFVADRSFVVVTGAQDDEGRCLKNKDLIQDVIVSGRPYHGMDIGREEWITIVPLGDKGSAAGVFVIVHGKKEDPSLKTLINYTVSIISSQILTSDDV